MQYILAGILIYLIYRFITGFVWPVYKATTMVKKQFGAMKEQMERASETQNQGFSEPPASEKPNFDLGGEYIPFEEIKEQKKA